MSRTYTSRFGGLPAAEPIARALGAGCGNEAFIHSWMCLHRPSCPPVNPQAVAAELRRRHWPAYRVRAWLAAQRGSYLGKERGSYRREYRRNFRHHNNQAIRSAEYADASDAIERWRGTGGWMTW